MSCVAGNGLVSGVGMGGCVLSDAWRAVLVKGRVYCLFEGYRERHSRFTCVLEAGGSWRHKIRVVFLIFGRDEVCSLAALSGMES